MARKGAKKGAKGADKKTRRKARTDSYASYIYKVLWYWEELECDEVNAILADRLQQTVLVNGCLRLGYGKLMERLMLMKLKQTPFVQPLAVLAERSLVNVSLPLEQPVVVLGDASYSMDVSIRVATCLASLFCCLLDQVEIRFFNSQSVKVDRVPRTVNDVLQMTVTVRADGLTAPAAALLDYYNEKRRVRTFVMVTDEIENESVELAGKAVYFPTLFRLYKDEVAPDCQLVFVSFLLNANKKGRMVSALEHMGIYPFQFCLDATRPDLTKLDALLGRLSSESEAFGASVQEGERVYESEQLTGLLNYLELASRESRDACESGHESSPGNVKATKEKEAVDEPVIKTDEKAANNTNGSCVICEEYKANTVMLDCGHVCTCQTCALLVKDQCPICRQTVKRKVRIFIP